MEFREEIAHQMFAAIVLKAHQQMCEDAKIFVHFGNLCTVRARGIKINKDDDDVTREDKQDAKADAERDTRKWYALEVLLNCVNSAFDDEVIRRMDRDATFGMTPLYEEILRRMRAYMAAQARNEPVEFPELPTSLLALPKAVGTPSAITE